MANTQLTISMITRKTMFVLHNAVVFSRNVDRGHDDQFAIPGAKIGTQLRIRHPARYTVTDGPTFVQQDSTDREEILVVGDQRASWTEEELEPEYQHPQREHPPRNAQAQESPDLTTYHESELSPAEEELEPEYQHPQREHPPRNAVVEGDDAPPEEEPPEEAEEEADLIEDSFDIPIRNEFGDEQPASVSTRNHKEAVERLKNERMLHSDYTRKTTELARQRDGIAEAVRQAQDQGRTAYVQQLEALKGTVLSTIEPELRNVDWQKLSTEDPQELLRLQARSQQLRSHLEVINQEQRNAAETQAREDYQRLQDRIKEPREVVSQTIPGWSDQRYSEILTTVSNRYGFTLEEVGQVIDPTIQPSSQPPLCSADLAGSTQVISITYGLGTPNRLSRANRIGPKVNRFGQGHVKLCCSSSRL